MIFLSTESFMESYYKHNFIIDIKKNSRPTLLESVA